MNLLSDPKELRVLVTLMFSIVGEKSTAIALQIDLEVKAHIDFGGKLECVVGKWCAQCYEAEL